MLWFGFGAQHPIRQLAQTTHGSSCIALCASLLRVLSDTEAAALIMAELANLYNAPEELTPSLQQWQALLDSSSGALMASPFGCVVDHFMRLSGDCTKRSRRFADPESLAKALQAIARLSTGSLISITLVGSWMWIPCGIRSLVLWS